MLRAIGSRRNLLHELQNNLKSKARGSLSFEFLGDYTLQSSSKDVSTLVQHSFSRGYKSSGLYVFHTNGGIGRDTASVSLGLLHALERFRPGVGYFRPIDKTSIGGHRSLLMKEIFKLTDDLESMKGVTQERAYELVTMEKVDDLMEEILKAYETYKANHDFVVIEGTGLWGFGDEVISLNARIASMLGASALLATDARPVANLREWQREVLNSAKFSDRVFRREHVDVLGGIVHGVPSLRSADVGILRDLFESSQIPFAGAIPTDSILESIQVEDVARTLGGSLLYTVENFETAMSTQVTNYVVATLQLSDFLAHLPVHSNPAQGCIIITDSIRVDILLGMMLLHETKSFSSNIAGIVLTGGMRPKKNVDLLLKSRSASGSLPIFLSSMPSFETSALLSKVEAKIQANSHGKVERAQTLFDDHVDMDVIMKAILQDRPVRMNSKLFQHNIFTRAKQNKQHIVLPEGDEPRTVQAAGAALRRGLCELTLLGNQEKIEIAAKKARVDISGARIIDPSTSPDLAKYAQHYYELRRHKGLTKELAYSVLITDPNYFGTCMVSLGDADGMVSGAVHTTANTVRPAFEIIKALPDLPIVSSVFFMCFPDSVLVYGDCAINSNPSSEELAVIAIQSADTASAFGVEPRVALLSYATGDSNKGPLIQKVIDATAIAKKKRPDLLIEGPLQYDAAVNPETARTKTKREDNPVAGKATVLIFPDLNTGNNTYKAVQQSTGALAMGPLLQGLRKPVNDLSRGCTVQDILTTIALTAVQAATLNVHEKRTEACNV